MAGIDFSRFVQQVGLAELAKLDRAEIATDFMPAAIAGLADGDMAILHEPYNGTMADLYGEHLYNESLVAQTIGRTALENGMHPGLVYDFQGFAADYFITLAKAHQRTYRSDSSIRIFPEAVTIDDNPLALQRSPQLVVDYGACLTGRSHIADQIAFLDMGERPFAYSPLTRLHFTNIALMNTYDANYGAGTAKAVIDAGLYIGREDGVGSATDEMINAQTAHGAPVDVADIILCAGTQHTTKQDLERGISNAYTLLKQGGMLLVRSLARPSEHEIGTQQIVNWAYQSGFPENSAIRYAAELASIGSLLLSGHFGEREIKTVVLTKE